MSSIAGSLRALRYHALNSTGHYGTEHNATLGKTFYSPSAALSLLVVVNFCNNQEFHFLPFFEHEVLVTVLRYNDIAVMKVDIFSTSVASEKAKIVFEGLNNALFVRRSFQ